MALTINLPVTNIGLPLANTYARITMMRGDKDGFLILVTHYANADARAADAAPVLNRTLVAQLSELSNGTDPLAMAYTWLKSQPDYVDALDC